MSDIPSRLAAIFPPLTSFKEIGRNKDLAKLGDAVTNLAYSLAKSLVSHKLTQLKVNRTILSNALKQANMKEYAVRRADAHAMADSTEAFIGYIYCMENWSVETLAEILLEKLHPFNLDDITQETEGAIEAFTHLLVKIKEVLAPKLIDEAP